MLISATPTHSLRSQMEGGLGEALQWTIGVASDDADVQCRTLASHVLSLSQNKLKEVSFASIVLVIIVHFVYVQA